MEGYEIICPKCDSVDIRFDSHAGFASCLCCGIDSEIEGPDFFKREVERKKPITESNYPGNKLNLKEWENDRVDKQTNK